jgi:hypothetical protein
MQSKKIYQVIIQDEYNNLTLVGFYKDLDDSIDDINEHLSTYNVRLSKGDLKEYPSTFSSVFDTDLADIFLENEEVAGVMIRGFILDTEETIKDIKKEEN